MSGETVGDRLRLIRLAYGRIHRLRLGGSQAEMARFAGIGKSAWNNCETGDTRLSIDHAMQLAQATGATLDYIFMGDRRGLPYALAVEIGKLSRAAKRSHA